MIKVEKFHDNGCDCTINGSLPEILDDIEVLFKALSKNKETELVLLFCIDKYITNEAKEILKKKGE